VDYTSIPITATFTAGTTSTTVGIPLAGDHIGEGSETFNLRFANISSSLSGVEIGERITTATARIIDATGHNIG